MRVIPTGGPLGAEIEGVDAGRPLPKATVGALRQALLEHLLLVLRGQSLSETQQVRFTRYFGEPVPHVRDQPKLGLDEVFVVSNVSENGRPIGALGAGELTFHSDLSYLDTPGSFSVVYAVEVPSRGGDTQWANAYLAYDALPPDLAERALELSAVHRHGEAAQNPKRPAVHPIVRTHPETGRRATFVSPQFTREIVGVPPEEGARLLARLLDHVTREEHVFTHRWRPGDLVIWDNRCTLHRREPFDPAERRVLKRTQILGDRPYLAK